MRRTIETICVIRFGSLGDLVLLTALLEALREGCPGAAISFVTKERYRPLFETDDRIDALHLLRGDGLKALFALRASMPGRFDALIDAHGVPRSAVLAGTLRAGTRVRIDKDQARKLLLIRRKIDRFPPGVSMAGRFVDLARRLGADLPHDPPPRLSPSPGAIAAAKRLLAGETGARAPVAIAPGARHETKRWPAGHFSALAAMLAARGETVVLVGGPDDQTVCREVAAKSGGAIDLSGRLDLPGTAALLARCPLLVSNDSAPLHIAEAVGTPVVALFGPTVGQFGYFPRLPASVVIEAPLDCRPCSRNGARPCPLGTKDCLESLAPARVFDAAAGILDGAGTAEAEGEG